MADKDTVIARANELLREVHLGSVTLAIVPDDVREEEGCCYIPVQPSSEPPHRTEYYEALADIESLILDEDDLNILFIPATAEV